MQPWKTPFAAVGIGFSLGLLGVAIASEVVEINVVEDPSGSLRFDPADRTISAGDTVKWVNTTNRQHTITPCNPCDPPAGPKVDPSPRFKGTDELAKKGTANKDSFSTVVGGPGQSIGYFCRIHPSMRGTITVK